MSRLPREENKAAVKNEERLNGRISELEGLVEERINELAKEHKVSETDKALKTENERLKNMQTQLVEEMETQIAENEEQGKTIEDLQAKIDGPKDTDDLVNKIRELKEKIAGLENNIENPIAKVQGLEEEVTKNDPTESDLMGEET